MSRFNDQSTGTKTTNLAGGDAFESSAKLKLLSLLFTSFVKDQFYRTSQEQLEEIKTLLSEVDPMFAAKAAIYARNELGMRSITHVLTAHLCKQLSGNCWTRYFVRDVVRRVDDITEILAYYFSVYGKKELPMSLRKGLALAFEKFNEYQIAKYKAATKKVKLVDAVNIVHPKHNEALEKLVKRTLKAPNTWEVEITQAGQYAKNEADKKELKADAWRRLIENKNLGYFALLRNLRNIDQVNDEEVMDEALRLLVNEGAIKASLLLPFRFHTAMKTLEKESLNFGNKIMRGISTALDISVSNCPTFYGKTLVILDVSGSMHGRPADIGSLFSAILLKSNPDADFMTFASEAQYSNINTLDTILGIVKSIMFLGGGTNFYSIFETINKAYKRIIILSDMQGWEKNGYFGSIGACHNEYRKKYECDPLIYSFDLSGYGSLQFPERNIITIAGFSDKILELMQCLEMDKNALMKMIDAVEIK